MAKHETTVTLKAKDQTGKAFDSFKKNAKEGEKAANKFSQGMDRAISIGAKLATAMTAAGAGIVAMGVSASSTIRELKGLSSASQLTINELRAYGAATKTVGVSTEQFADIVKDVNDKLGEFVADGAGPFVDFFDNVPAALRPTADELARLSGPEVLVAVKKSMDDANLSAKEQIFILESLGNDASKLIPILEDGGRAMNDMAEGFRKTNEEITELDIANIEAFGRGIDKLGASAEETKLSVTSLFGPFFEAVADRVDELSQGTLEFADNLLGLSEKNEAIFQAREAMKSSTDVAKDLKKEVKGVADAVDRVDKNADGIPDKLEAASKQAKAFAGALQFANDEQDKIKRSLEDIQGIREDRSSRGKKATVLGALTASSEARRELERGNTTRAAELALKAAEELRQVEEQTGENVTNAEAFIKNFEQIAKEALERSEKAQEQLKLVIEVDGQAKEFGFNAEGVKQAGDFTTDRIKEAARKAGKR